MNILQGPVQFGDDGTIIYTKIWMVQMRLNENGNLHYSYILKVISNNTL